MKTPFIFALLLCYSVLLMGSSPLPKRNISPKSHTQNNIERLLILSPDGPIVLDVSITLNGLPYYQLHDKAVRKGLGRKKSAPNPIPIRVVDPGNTNDDSLITDLKNILDTNYDKLLSKEELLQLKQVLSDRDVNANDVIELREVSKRIIVRRGSKKKKTFQPVYPLGKTKTPNVLWTILKDRYGRDKKIINKQSMRFLATKWNQLDLNNNQQLDLDELTFFHSMKPHIVLNVDLHNGKKTNMQLISVAKEFKHIKVEKNVGVFKFLFPTYHLVLHTPLLSLSKPKDASDKIAQKMIEQLDADKNGKIEQKEFQKNRRAAIYYGKFEDWDVNDDKMISVNEVETSYSLMLSPYNRQLYFTTKYKKRVLFSLLDQSGDERISQREVCNAKKRLLEFDINKDGELTAAELPQLQIVSFSQGGTNSLTLTRNVKTIAGFTSQKDADLGPRWFVHMDKNADGDVTPREFLGKTDMFQQIDTNHDGFIEKKEAEVATIHK